MKIDNSIKTAVVSPMGEALARPDKAGQKTEGATASNDDNVQLSAQLRNIEKNFASGEVFNAARVEEIKKAISEGHFVVNPDKVADRLLETVRDLIQTRHG
ncbi:anti-sigma-28 factor, FlgM family [Nitrosospira sp. Nl5]|uniref:flagellar biosynthesis anti-sigma factor FlgM n=1 Tax=Nitrosospira sp. Nl5 TaxID=200120 RepID=UPI00087F9428|nr:flagellar biosynthesis anti-sigma factor FlgM [Nitrosospira sp. Nl5]SCY06534.1 anti-sigma-28 factor, FlgM family [Nitrosospira sp. Nl5]